MLTDLLDERLVCLEVAASDWEEAVRVSVRPLVDAEMVSEAYADAIIRGVREMGPYVVVAPHVALPHARPECGALGNALGVVTLQGPVTFGSEENDPVRYLFPLSATDNDGHLGALQELVELLGRPEFFERLDGAKTPAEVVEAVRSMAGGA